MSRDEKQTRKVFVKKVESGLMDGVPFLGLFWVLFKGVRSVIRSRK